MLLIILRKNDAIFFRFRMINPEFLRCWETQDRRNSGFIIWNRKNIASFFFKIISNIKQIYLKCKKNNNNEPSKTRNRKWKQNKLFIIADGGYSRAWSKKQKWSTYLWYPCSRLPQQIVGQLQDSNHHAPQDTEKMEKKRIKLNWRKESRGEKKRKIVG